MDVTRRKNIDDAVWDLARRQNYISGFAAQAGPDAAVAPITQWLYANSTDAGGGGGSGDGFWEWKAPSEITSLFGATSWPGKFAARSSITNLVNTGVDRTTIIIPADGYWEFWFNGTARVGTPGSGPAEMVDMWVRLDDGAGHTYGISDDMKYVPDSISTISSFNCNGTFPMKAGEKMKVKIEHDSGATDVTVSECYGALIGTAVTLP